MSFSFFFTFYLSCSFILSLREINENHSQNGDTASQLTAHIQTLRSEVDKLRTNLAAAEKESQEKSQQFAQEEKCIREENIRLQRKLQLEVERREALCRHLSESESSLEMEEERLFNENVYGMGARQRTISSPAPSPSNSRPLSPGVTNRCYACGQIFVSTISFSHIIDTFLMALRSIVFSESSDK